MGSLPKEVKENSGQSPQNNQNSGRPGPSQASPKGSLLSTTNKPLIELNQTNKKEVSKTSSDTVPNTKKEQVNSNKEKLGKKRKI